MSESGHKECPYCGEEIKTQAIKCKYCHSMLDNGNEKDLLDKRTPLATVPISSNAWLKPVLMGVCVLAVAIVAILLLSTVPVSEDVYSMSEEEYIAEASEHLEELLRSLYALAYSMPLNLDISKELVAKIEGPSNEILTLDVPKSFREGHDDITMLVSLANEFCTLHLSAIENMDATIYDGYDGGEKGMAMGAKLRSGLTKMAAAVRNSNPELAGEIDHLLKHLTYIANIDPNEPTMDEWLETTIWVSDLSNKTQNIALMPTENVTKVDIAIFRDTLKEVRYLNPPFSLAKIYYNDYLPRVLDFEKYADAIEEGNPLIAYGHVGNALGMFSDESIQDAIASMFYHLGEIEPTEN